MNTIRIQQETPRNTNLAIGRGHGHNRHLPRKKFINGFFSKDDSSTGYLYQTSSSVRRFQVLLRRESLVSIVERPVGATTPSGGPAKRSLEDRGSSIREGGLEEVY